jgi:DNA-binding transcriptional LysR family regulator
MDTHRLTQFCLVVETGSLTRAARLLHVTHSALSKSIKTLARDLDVELIAPQGRGISITADGLAAYRKAKELLELEARLFKTHRDAPKPQPALRIGAVEVFLLAITAGLRRTPFAEDPISLLDLEPNAMANEIAHGRLDYAITYALFPTERAEETEVGRYTMGCYRLHGAFEGLPWNELPFAVPATGLDRNPLGVKERDGWQEALFPRRKRFAVNLLSTGLDLTARGLCAIYIPHFVAKLHNESSRPEKRLVPHALPRELEPTTHRVFVLRASNAPEGPTFKRLCAMLRAIIRA